MTLETIRQKYGRKASVERLIVLVAMFLLPLLTRAQRLNVSTNLLYWATTTPNISIEGRLARHYTLSLSLGYNPFNYKDNEYDVDPKLHHWIVYPEVKYWFCRAFERGYIGLHAFYGRYDAGGLEFPSFLSEHRYKGYGLGAGLSYGYQWALGKRWGIEASAGVGYVYVNYDKYDCGSCDGEKTEDGKKHFVLPTKAAVSIIYFIK